MNKTVRIIHRICVGISILMLGGSLVYYLIRWGQLPAEIGVHFAPSGEFDVIAQKLYGFYPHLIGGLIIAGIAVAGHFLPKLHTGMKVTETGERHFKAALLLTLDGVMLICSFLFTMWSRAVSLQIPLDAQMMGNGVLLTFLLAFVGIIAQIVTCIRHRSVQKQAPSADSFHRLSRLIAWLLAAGGLCVLAVSWERFPSDPALYNDPAYHGLAHFANLGTYLDKHLLLIPHGAAIAILAAVEIVCVKATKAGKAPLAALTDKIRLICGVFFCWWLFVLDVELPIGIVSVGLFVILMAVVVAGYVLKKKNVPPAPTESEGET